MGSRWVEIALAALLIAASAWWVTRTWDGGGATWQIQPEERHEIVRAR